MNREFIAKEIVRAMTNYNLSEEQEHALLHVSQIVLYNKTQDIINLQLQNEIMKRSLISISNNTCCENCQEAKLVAKAALKKLELE